MSKTVKEIARENGCYLEVKQIAELNGLTRDALYKLRDANTPQSRMRLRWYINNAQKMWEKAKNGK